MQDIVDWMAGYHINYDMTSRNCQDFVRNVFRNFQEWFKVVIGKVCTVQQSNSSKLHEDEASERNVQKDGLSTSLLNVCRFRFQVVHYLKEIWFVKILQIVIRKFRNVFASQRTVSRLFPKWAELYF